MDPVMLRIGDFEIKWYSILILLGVIFAYYLLEKESKKYNYPKDFIFNLFFWAIIAGFIGARLYYVVFNWTLYRSDPLSIFKIWEGGLAIHGGIIAALIFIIIYLLFRFFACFVSLFSLFCEFVLVNSRMVSLTLQIPRADTCLIICQFLAFFWSMCMNLCFTLLSITFCTLRWYSPFLKKRHNASLVRLADNTAYQ